MKYAFVAANQDQFKTRPMCRMLGVHPSGFYAWVKEPISHRALEDERQTALLKKAWKDSGKVYGYRKIYDDLIDMGEAASENRIDRMQHEKRILEERLQNTGKSHASFEETFELALRFLANPLKIWQSGQLDMQRLVLIPIRSIIDLSSPNSGLRLT